MLGVAVGIGILIGTYLNFQNTPVNVFVNNPEEVKLKKIIDFINYEYVDKVDSDSLLDKTIDYLMNNLDPHSTYIPAEEMLQVSENMQGRFVGIGVQFQVVRDTLRVVQVVEGGPSEKVGVKTGDRILIADADTLYGKGLRSNEIIGYLKGKAGTTVNLTLYRKSENQILNVPVKRGSVPIKSVETSYMLDDETGYIKVTRFAETTYREFSKSLRSLKELGMKRMVLDLRDNSGGFLHIAERMADDFLEDGKLIVFTRNRNGVENKRYASERGGFESGEVFVLINENSASASEIVAGALQDNDRATIVGRRSFGKGLVQREMEFEDGSAIRLTTSRYYTPTGRSIQKPYSNGNESEYRREYQKRFASGELYSRDSIEVNDSLRFVTPQGKVVYGGGGIIPDVFVGIDSTQYSNWLYRAMSYGRMMDFVFDYADQNRAELEEKTIKDFQGQDKPIYKAYMRQLSKEGIDSSGTVEDKALLIKRLTALMARHIHGDEAYYKILGSIDPMLKKVEEL